MMFQQKRITQINAASVADIAFMLLFFFLATTTLNFKSGILRTIPNDDAKNAEIPVIKRRNVFSVNIQTDGTILVNKKKTAPSAIKNMCLAFYLNPQNADTLSEKTSLTIPNYGEYLISKGLIQIEYYAQSPFETYVFVQNEIITVVNELQNIHAKILFSKPYDKCTETQQSTIRTIVPIKISENLH